MSSLSTPKLAYSWGHQKNMAYDWGEYSEVKNNVNHFLKQNGFSIQEKSVTLIPVHKNRFGLINQQALQGLKKIKVGKRDIEADAIFTKLKKAPLVCKPADCAVLCLSFVCQNQLWIGIIHVGIHDFALDTLRAVKIFIQTDIGVYENLEINVSPFLHKYIIKNLEGKRELFENPRTAKWIVKENEQLYFDFHSALKADVSEVFDNAHITFTNLDTWQGAANGKCFSHSYSAHHQEANEGRNIVCVEIPTPYKKTFDSPKLEAIKLREQISYTLRN